MSPCLEDVRKRSQAKNFQGDKPKLASAQDGGRNALSTGLAYPWERRPTGGRGGPLAVFICLYCLWLMSPRGLWENQRGLVASLLSTESSASGRHKKTKCLPKKTILCKGTTKKDATNKISCVVSKFPLSGVMKNQSAYLVNQAGIFPAELASGRPEFSS